MLHSCSTSKMPKSPCAGLHNARKPIPGQVPSQASIYQNISNILVWDISRDIHLTLNRSKMAKTNTVNQPHALLNPSALDSCQNKSIFQPLNSISVQLQPSTCHSHVTSGWHGAQRELPSSTGNLLQSLSHSTFISTVCMSWKQFFSSRCFNFPLYLADMLCLSWRGESSSPAWFLSRRSLQHGLSVII